MASLNNGKTEEIQQEPGQETTLNSCEERDRSQLYMQKSRVGMLDKDVRKSKFLGMISTLDIRSAFKRVRSPGELLSSPSIKFRQMVVERDEISRSVTSPADHDLPRNSRIPFARKINWVSLLNMSKEWIRNPMNMALFAWIIVVAVSGAILFMVMTGMLNSVLPKKTERNTWFEVNNQILNAMFTLMCLYQHPRRFHHLALLCRWKEEDILRLRKIYCKNGSYKPHEWAHMMVVVVLLHINCFAQYALCGLNLGYHRSQRSALGVGVCLSMSFTASAIATIYNILSPLGKDYAYETDPEALCADVVQPTQARVKSLAKKYSFIAREDQRVAETRPVWVGGLFDLWDDLPLAYLSVFCSFCVFGWNMDRLGFGNMYVHIATFLLLCLAPFWIFNLAAINIDNEVVREALGISGIILCVFGLLYGGFWRIQMRKKFNLPANTFCCGNPAVTDCFQWLCCCSCSLAQEARTADFYDVVEDKFYSKEMVHGTSVAFSPLPPEGSSPLIRSIPGSPLLGNSTPSVWAVTTASPNRFFVAHDKDVRLPEAKEESPTEGMGITMAPPIPPMIQREINS